MKNIFLALAVLLSAYATAQKTYIHCGKLIDAVSNSMLSEKTIIIEGNKIVEIKDGYATPGADDKLVDLKTKTVMPGLMDMHVHLESQTKRNAQADRLTKEAQDIAFYAAVGVVLIPISQR